MIIPIDFSQIPHNPDSNWVTAEPCKDCVAGPCAKEAIYEKGFAAGYAAAVRSGADKNYIERIGP